MGCVAAVSFAGDWTRFRGPNGSGVSADEIAAPVTWSATKNLKWKAPLPGPGSSSPIIVGDRIYVTCWSGYGTDRGNRSGNQENLKRHLICLDRQTGKTIWDKSVKAVLPEDNYGGMFAEHGYASHTPVSDGERIYVFFGKSGALAFDLDGNQLWQTPVGTGSDRMGWGSACSPILYKNLVIVTASAESQAMYALDKLTGKEVWKASADGFGSTWGTPVLVEVDANRTDIVVGVPYEIWGFNPDTGKLRWYCEALGTRSFCSSVVTDGKLIYAMGDQGSGSIAIKAGGEKDVTKTHVAWTGRESNRIGTPVVADGRLYFVNNRVATCIDATNGSRVYQGRLASSSAAGEADQGGRPGGRPGGGGFGGGGRGGGQDYSSAVVGGGKLYYVSRGGDIHVIKLGDTFELLATNRVTDEPEDFSATPALSNGQLFIRSSKHLYCVADTSESK
jgi:hypothetical protein